ncbi:MAG: VWA domain-containing protein, partial [Acidimicrobiales bacterium]|nr:VWA domain-containing protein [Acidimicrobiales bacterium]
MTQRIWRISAAILVALFAISSPALAQDAETDEAAAARDRKIQILRVKQDEGAGTVELIVALPAAIGEVAPTTSNFGVIEGQNNKTFTVEPVEDNVDVVIVVDTSGSMRGAPLTAARQAAAGFIDRLPPEARVSVVGFGATPTVLTTFENDRSSSRSAVNSLVARGETALWDALLTASETATAGGSRAPYIVVLSDGGDTASVGTQAQANAALEQAGATLYAITLETAESDHRALLSTADEVSGTVLATGDIGALETLFDEVGDRLNHRYRIVIKSDRTDERALRVSVAIEGAIATASTTIGVGGAPTAPVAEVPTSLG